MTRPPWTIGVYDPSAPPKKLQPTPRGYGLAAALEKCRELADIHAARADTGGLREAKAEKRKTSLAQKAVEAEKSERTLQKLLDAYVTHLKIQGRRSHVDADLADDNYPGRPTTTILAG